MFHYWAILDRFCVQIQQGFCGKSIGKIKIKATKTKYSKLNA